METQKRRRLQGDGDELAGLNDEYGGGQLPPHLKEEPAGPQAHRIAQLEGKLKHLRNWMQAVQNQMQAQPMNRDTVFNARRLFVGGVPLGTSDEELSKFLGNAIISTGAAISDTGRPVTYCRIQREKNFAFVEVRSAEEASNAMALDGLLFQDVPLKIKRPSKYDQAASFMLGPTEPDPSLDLSQVQISQPPPAPAAAAAAGGPTGAGELPQGKYEATHNTLYIGGLPIEWSHDQCMELLKMYGEVKYFRLMMDRQTGNSRGFAFAEYTTDVSTTAALAALDGAQLGPRRITANRMLEHKQKQQQQQGMWPGQQMGGPGGGSGGAWGNRPGGSGGMMGRGPPGAAGMWPQQGNMGMQQQGMGPEGLMPPGGRMMPQNSAAGGMQQGPVGGAAGYGADGMTAGYGMGAAQQAPPQLPLQPQLPQQQGMYAAGGMGPQAGLAGGGMDAAQQGMYGGMGQAGPGGCDGYGGQMQQGAGMNAGGQMPAGQQQPQQGGMGMPMGAGAGGGYGQLNPQQQQQQQQQGGYGAALGAPMGMSGGPMGGGMQGGMGGMGGMPVMQQGPSPVKLAYGGAAAVQPSGPASTGMGGCNMGGWQGQQQGWLPQGQHMQNWG